MAVAEHTNIQEIKDAAIRVRELSADEKAKQIAFEREMNLFEKEYFFSSFERVKEQLNEANTQLNEANTQLNEANTQLKETQNKLENAEELVTLKNFSGLVADGILTVEQAYITVEEFKAKTGMN